MEIRNIGLPASTAVHYASSNADSYTSSPTVNPAALRAHVASPPPVFDYTTLQLSPSSHSQTHIPVAYAVPNFMSGSPPYGVMMNNEQKQLAVQNGSIKQSSVQSGVAAQGSQSVQAVVSTLRQELAATKQQNAALSDQYNTLVREINEMKQTVQRLHRERDEYAREMQYALQGRLMVTQDYAQVVEDRNQLRSEYNAVMSERDTVHREIDSLTEQLRNSQRTVERLQRELAEQSHNESQREREQLESDRRSMRVELSRLGLLAQERVQELALLQDERGKLLAELETVRSRVKQLEDQLHVAQAERDVAQRERVEAIEHRETILSETYNRARLDAADRSARELDTLRGELDAALRELDTLRRSETASRQELAGALRELDAAQQQRDFAFKQRDQAVAERESMRLLSDRIRTERDEFVSQLANALRESDELRKVNRELCRRTAPALADARNELQSNVALALPVSASHDSAIDTSQTSQFGGEPVYFASSASAQSNAAAFEGDTDAPTGGKSTRAASHAANTPRATARSRPTTPVMPKWLFAATASTSCSSPDANTAHYASLATSASSNSVSESGLKNKVSMSCANVNVHPNGNLNANASGNTGRQSVKLSAILDRARDHVISKLGKYQRTRKEVLVDSGTVERGKSEGSNGKKERHATEPSATGKLNGVFRRKDKSGKKTHSDSHLSLASSCSSSLQDSSLREPSAPSGEQSEHDALRQLDSVLSSVPAYSRPAAATSASISVSSSNDRPHSLPSTPEHSGTGTWPKRCAAPLAFSLSPSHAGEIVFEYSAAAAAAVASHDTSTTAPKADDPEATLRRDAPPKCSGSPRRPPLSAAAWFNHGDSAARRPVSAYFEFESQSLLSNSNSNSNRRRTHDNVRCETLVLDAAHEAQNAALGMRIQCTPDGSVLVAAVAVGGRAERANVRVGDELLEANHKPLRGHPHAYVTQVLKQCGSGDLRLIVRRRSEEHDEDGSHSASVSITPTASRQASVRTSHTAPATSALRPNRTSDGPERPVVAAPRIVKLERRGQSLGIALVGGHCSGIFVNEVLPGSVASLAGVRVGDQILEYNGLSMRPSQHTDGEERNGLLTGEMALRELQKPVERCTLLLQFVGGRRFDELRTANTGELFFVRACLDRDAASDGELTFRCGSILLVDSTLWNVTAGLWHAHTLDEFGNRIEHGTIPSIARMEEEWLSLQAQFPHLASTSGGMYETVSAASTVSSQRHAVSDSLRKTFQRRSFNQSTSHSPPDSASPSASQRCRQAHGSAGALTTYVRVERYDELRSRPVCILGALNRTLICKLSTEHSDRFAALDFEPSNHSAASLERELEDGTILDYRKQRRSTYELESETTCVSDEQKDDDGPFECIVTQKLLERLDRSHAGSSRLLLLDISGAAIDRLANKLRLHPIVIFIKHKSPKQIREVKDIHYMPEQVSRHCAQTLFEEAQRLERELHKLFTCTIPGGNLAFMCTQVKFAIDNEQRKPIWIAARCNNMHAPLNALPSASAELGAHFAYAGKQASSSNQQMGMISTSSPVDV